MATLQTADGRLLRSQRPAGAGLWGLQTQGGFPPLWSNGERAGDDGTILSFDQVFRSQPVVRTAVDKIAKRIATLPFDAFDRTANDGRELDSSSSLASLIHQPWPRAGAVHLNHFIAQSLLVHGNALVAKLRTADREAPPFMLWPLDWSQISAWGPVGGRIEWWSTFQFDGTEGFFKAEDVLHFAWAAPSGSEIGVSPLETLEGVVRNDVASREYSTNSLRGGNRPSLALTFQQPLKAEQRDHVLSQVDNMHKRGSGLGAKTLVLSGGADVKTLSMTPVEAGLIDSRKLNREEVGMVYDLPGPLMNDLSHATLANVAEYQKALYRDVLPVWTELMVQTFQRQLIDVEPSWLDKRVRFDFSEKLRGEPEAMAGLLKTEVEAGLISRNEARVALGYEPEGDPNDPENPANLLSANVNNQAPLAAMQSVGDTPAPAAPQTAAPAAQ
jgi:HK97 family phage portal protein